LRIAPLPFPTAPLKCVVGIDIAKDSFVACGGYSTLSQQLHFGKETTFANTESGFVALLSWAVKQHVSGSALWFVVEATGVHYEELAYFLANNQHLLSVLLPNKVKHFARSTELKSKTDQLDARLLCRLGLERALPAWQPPTPALRQLRALARERQVLVRQAAQLKIRTHAYQRSYQPDSRTLARLAAQQQLVVSQLKALD
jgi:transposase